MKNRNTAYIAVFLILATFGLQAHATLPDSRQYVVHLEQNSAKNYASETLSHGSVLIMVSPAGESIQFKATLTNIAANCELTLFTTTDSGKSRTIATLNPTMLKIERAGDAGSRVHLSGALSREDLAAHLKTGSIEDLCRLLRDNNILLKANFYPDNQKGFAM